MIEKKPKASVRPLFLIKPKTMSAEDIRRAERLCALVIVECQEPDAVRLLEPAPDADVPEQARACLALMRWVASTDKTSFYKSELVNWLVNRLLMEPSPQRVKHVTKK